MDFKSLIYSPKKVKEAVSIQGEKLVAIKECKIYIPCSYEERRLMTMGNKVNTLGIFLLVVDNKYSAVFCAQARVILTPTALTKIKHEDESVYELFFEPGASILDSIYFVKDDTMPYYIYNEFIDMGRVPFFFKYTHFLSLFKESKHYTGTTVGAHKAIVEAVVSTISRDRKDHTNHYRRAIKTYNDMEGNPPIYVPLSDVVYTATNTMARISGAYFDNGLVTALVKPTERMEAIEEILLL